MLSTHLILSRWFDRFTGYIHFLLWTNMRRKLIGIAAHTHFLLSVTLIFLVQLGNSILSYLTCIYHRFTGVAEKL